MSWWTRPKTSVPSQLVPALHGLVEAEELRLAAAGDQLAEQRAGQRLGAAEHDADQHRQREERQERAVPARRRRAPRRAATGRGCRGPPATRRRDGASRPNSSAPPKADELHQQHRDDQLALAEAELLGAVQAGGRDDGLDAVVVEQVGQQEQQRLRVGAAARANVRTSWRRLPPTTPARRVHRGRRGAAQVTQAEHGDEGEGPAHHRPADEQADPDRAALGRARPGRAA